MVRYDTIEIEPPYREALADILAFSTFDQAEATIRKLENLCRKYRAASDKKGVEYCRQIALLGRRRAERISGNKRVSLNKRIQKREIADWFRMWLETPDLFEDWLAMRKGSEEFKKFLE
jgi:hypothetical protein